MELMLTILMLLEHMYKQKLDLVVIDTIQKMLVVMDIPLLILLLVLLGQTEIYLHTSVFSISLESYNK